MNVRGGHLYEFGPFLLDAAERKLSRRGRPVALPDKAFDVLLALVGRGGRLVEKDELLREVWPDSFVEEANLAVHVAKLRSALHDNPRKPSFIETVPKHGYRFVAKVRCLSGGEEETAPRSPSARMLPAGMKMPQAKLEPTGGAIPLPSKFYIERPTDAEFRSAIAARQSIVLVQGPRQVGKTSLLARGLQQAREAGARVIVTDFQSLSDAHLESAERLLLAFAEWIGDQLGLDVSPAETWLAGLSPGTNLGRYLRRQVFGKVSEPIVWGLDEVDRLFPCRCANEVFGLFRSWHNSRALDPEGGWYRLTLAMCYATEARLFLTDPHQSPFNVGTRLSLEDFTREEVAELNRRYGRPLRDEAEELRFFRLINGQPYLAHKGLYEMAARGLSLSDLAAQAHLNKGVFGDHLQRVLDMLRGDEELCRSVRALLREGALPDPECFYRLRSAGVVKGESPSDAAPRCELYASYLAEHL